MAQRGPRGDGLPSAPGPSLAPARRAAPARKSGQSTPSKRATGSTASLPRSNASAIGESATQHGVQPPVASDDGTPSGLLRRRGFRLPQPIRNSSLPMDSGHEATEPDLGRSSQEMTDHSGDPRPVLSAVPASSPSALVKTKKRKAKASSSASSSPKAKKRHHPDPDPPPWMATLQSLSEAFTSLARKIDSRPQPAATAPDPDPLPAIPPPSQVAFPETETASIPQPEPSPQQDPAPVQVHDDPLCSEHDSVLPSASFVLSTDNLSSSSS